MQYPKNVNFLEVVGTVPPRLNLKSEMNNCICLIDTLRCVHLKPEVQWLKALFTAQCFPKTQKNVSGQESRRSLAGPVQEELCEHYHHQEVHQCLIQYEHCQRSTHSIMLENGVSIRKKTLFLLQNLFLPDSLRDPQEEAENKRGYFTRKKQKIHLKHYAEK